MNLTKTLGINIKKHRELNNLLLNDLAIILNISYNYLNNIEKGECNLSIELIEKIADALKIDIKDLFKS